jgi:hypothetical protein
LAGHAFGEIGLDDVADLVGRQLLGNLSSMTAENERGLEAPAHVTQPLDDPLDHLVDEKIKIRKPTRRQIPALPQNTPVEN